MLWGRQIIEGQETGAFWKFAFGGDHSGKRPPSRMVPQIKLDRGNEGIFADVKTMVFDFQMKFATSPKRGCLKGRSYACFE